MAVKDLKGKIFGRLIVLEFSHLNQRGKPLWKCQCSCGNPSIRIVQGGHLKTGHTKSCGCYSRERIIERSVKHNLSNHPLSSVWYSLNHRCSNLNNADYGGRGIQVCEEWTKDQKDGNGLGNFLAWSEKQAAIQGILLDDLFYKKHGKVKFWSLDRIDNSKGYSPENCKWSTCQDQIKNRRNAIRNEHYDKLFEYTRHLENLLKENDIPFQTIFSKS